MSDKDKSMTAPGKTVVVERPQLKRDRAFALLFARNRARNHGKPMPDPATIGPAVFTKLTPEMSREQKVENVIAALERMGVSVKRNKEIGNGEKDDDS